LNARLAMFFRLSPAVLKSEADVGGQLPEFDGTNAIRRRNRLNRRNSGRKTGATFPGNAH
jgi:hypothetical protein